MQLASRLGATALALLLWSPAAEAVPIDTLFNTGVNAAGTPQPNGTLETHYTIVSGPIMPTPVVRTSAGGFPVPPWLPDNTISAWISPTAEFSNPSGVFIYRTTFDLTGLDPGTASIVGVWSTDNDGQNILINGTPLGFTTDLAQFSIGFASFSVSSGFVAGINTLDFVVNDISFIGGLRVQLAGTANPVAPVPESEVLWLLVIGLAAMAFRHHVGLNGRGDR
jgi:hypothetical protein